LSNYDTNSTVTASYSQPTNTTVSTDGKSFTLAQNQNVTIPVTFTWLVKNPGANTYAAQMQGINYEVSGSAKTTTTFMAGQTAWRTPSTN
jgi:archaellum component FlaG (FlaF/FlaG flagellin family)